MVWVLVNYFSTQLTSSCVNFQMVTSAGHGSPWWEDQLNSVRYNIGGWIHRLRSGFVQGSFLLSKSCQQWPFLVMVAIVDIIWWFLGNRLWALNSETCQPYLHKMCYPVVVVASANNIIFGCEWAPFVFLVGGGGWNVGYLHNYGRALDSERW